MKEYIITSHTKDGTQELHSSVLVDNVNYDINTAFKEAVKDAEKLTDHGYAYVAVSLRDGSYPMEKAIKTSLLNKLWLNGHLTALGEEWNKQ